MSGSPEFTCQNDCPLICEFDAERAELGQRMLLLRGLGVSDQDIGQELWRSVQELSQAPVKEVLSSYKREQAQAELYIIDQRFQQIDRQIDKMTAACKRPKRISLLTEAGHWMLTICQSRDVLNPNQTKYHLPVHIEKTND